MKRLTLTIQTHRDVLCPICFQPLTGEACYFYYGVAICSTCYQTTKGIVLQETWYAAKHGLPGEWTWYNNLMFFTPGPGGKTTIAEWIRYRIGEQL